jgi:hypothetical protein
MATLSAMSPWLGNQLINHLLRDTGYTPSSSVWAGLFTVTPSDTRTGTEVSGGGYARQEITSSNIGVTGGSAVNTAIIEFPEATADWGVIVGVAIFNAATSGSILFWGRIDNQLTIYEGEVYSINIGELIIELNGGFSGGWGDGMPYEMLDFVLKNGTYVSPGSSVYMALGKNLVYDSDYTFLSWDELTSMTYSRKNITAWNTPANGITSNTNEVVFQAPPIADEWGRITHVVIFDNSAGGNALLWGKLKTPIWIIAGDGLKFAAGDIDIAIT